MAENEGFLRRLYSGFRFFLKRILDLATQPVFIVVTVLGNACILLGTCVLYSVEHDVNPKLQSFLDAVWWAVATVSTVGYGDISPITPAGKVVGIGMMIIGTALFSAYTALFAGALVSTEMGGIEKEVKGLGKAVSQIGHEVELDEQTLHHLISTMESALSGLNKLKKKKTHDATLHSDPKSGA